MDIYEHKGMLSTTLSNHTANYTPGAAIPVWFEEDDMLVTTDNDNAMPLQNYNLMYPPILEYL